MLPGGENRHADQREPRMQHPAPAAGDVPREQHPQYHQQRHVKRRRLVVGLIEAPQHVEQNAEHAVGRRFLEREAQREQQKAADRDRLRAQEPLAVSVELVAGGAYEKRKPVQQIDRPVRHDGPCCKGNVPLPAEYDRADVGALTRGPVRETIGREKQWPEECEPGKRALPRTSVRRWRLCRCFHYCCKTLNRR